MKLADIKPNTVYKILGRDDLVLSDDDPVRPSASPDTNPRNLRVLVGRPIALGYPLTPNGTVSNFLVEVRSAQVGEEVGTLKDTVKRYEERVRQERREREEWERRLYEQQGTAS